MEGLTSGSILQVNGGNIEAKVDYAYSLFEKPVTVGSLFEENEMIDTIAITKGRGTEGVVTRWGVSRLPRKTHRGLRKVLHASLDILLLPTHSWWHSLHRPFASSSSLLLPASIGDKQSGRACLVLRLTCTCFQSMRGIERRGNNSVYPAGCLHWRLASSAGVLDGSTCWSAWLPSQDRDEQEDIQDWGGRRGQS